MFKAFMHDEDYEKVALFFSCESISKFSPTGELYLVLLKQIEKFRFMEIGRTERVRHTINPEFTKNFELNFVFKTTQCFKVQVFERSDNFMGDSLIGSAVFELADIAGSFNTQKLISLQRDEDESSGQCLIRMDKIESAKNYEFSFALKVTNVPKRCLFSRVTSFLRIYKLRRSPLGSSQLKQTIFFQNLLDEDWLCIETTSPEKGKSFETKPISIKGSKLCNNDFTLPLKVELWKYKADGSHRLLGSVILKVADVLARKIFRFNLLSANSKSLLEFTGLIAADLLTFTDYLKEGLNINLMVGIDFSLSSKKPTDPTSLHYLKPGSLNVYQQVILAIGEIIGRYNHSKRFSAFGLGAKRNNSTSSVSQFFPLKNDQKNPFFSSFDELFEAYKATLADITYSGITLYAPVLKQIVDYSEARYKVNPYNYTIILLVTDGVIHDLQETKDEIVRASALPISIIIVGVGYNDFSSMEALDADQTPITNSKGQPMSRDIVQFVPFNKFANHPIMLRHEVLEELPEQVTSFYHKKGPLPRKTRMSIFRPGDDLMAWARAMAGGSGHQDQNNTTVNIS